MSTLADLKMYGRFAWGLRGYLRRRITLEEARATLRQRIAERESNFLRVVERGIFGYPRSPYLPLLKLAGCELGDLRNMVRSKGLDATLTSLREAGVHISFEEFKGRMPIVRDGRVISVQPRDFDNPYLRRYYEAQSGGSTGAGTRAMMDLDHAAVAALKYILTYDAHGILGLPTVYWRGILPDASAIGLMLIGARFGQVPQKWFTPITTKDWKPSRKYSLATQYIIAMARLSGVPIPWPEPVDLDHAARVAQYAAQTLQMHRACLISAPVSLSLRIANAAWEEGLDLTGATFQGGGEPPTPAKVRGITRTGARWVPAYGSTEVGLIGLGCAQPSDGNDLHFFKDDLALIQHSRVVPGTNMTVDAFHFTSLSPTAPKLLLNVESDDYGIIERRSCGCPLGDFGYTEHLREVHSFRKLTGEGVTLIGSEMVRILEEVLPARFGGGPLDYQLLEEEDTDGLTRLSLVVSPKVPIEDEKAVIGVMLEALGRSSGAADLARAIWSKAGTLRVRRIEPIWTARGKLTPLHLATHARQSAEATSSPSIPGLEPHQQMRR